MFGKTNIWHNVFCISISKNQTNSISVAEVHNSQQAGTTVLVDIKDIRELQRDGCIDGGLHAPRVMLEFWADLDNPYHKDIFATKPRWFFVAPRPGAKLLLKKLSKIWAWIIFGIWMAVRGSESC